MTIAVVAWALGCRVLVALLPLALLCLPALAADAAWLRVSLADVRASGFSASAVLLDLPRDEGPAKLEIGHLALGKQDYGRVVLACPQARRLSGGRLECPSGHLSAGGRLSLPLSFSLDPGRGEFRLKIRAGEAEGWQVDGNWHRGVFRVALDGARLDHLATWFPGFAAWNLKGSASGWAQLSPGEASLDLDLAGVSFGNADGTLAGDRMGGHLKVRGGHVAGKWEWNLAADWREGEAYFAPLYLPSGGLKLALKGESAGGVFELADGRLEMAGVGSVAFSGKGRWPDTLDKLHFQAAGLDLEAGGKRLLQPLLENAGLPKLAFGGRLDVSGDWENGHLAALDARLREGRVEEAGGVFGLAGIRADLPWRKDGGSSARFESSGGHWRGLPIGGFQFTAQLNGMSFLVPKLQIPVLDGALVLEDVQAVRKGLQWDWEGHASIWPISMVDLSRALGLPAMAGSISGVIPRISRREGRIALDGTLIVQVFEGYLACQGISLDDAFGSVPVLRAKSVDIRHLNLGMLTQAYSFGEITGYLDGDMDGLEMVGWQPQRFDVSLRTSPGDFERRISQKAVQNISSLGGAGAGAAIQASFLSFFKTFGYKNIGISCRLRNGVCTMGGVKTAPQGYVLIEGGGVPALTVIGYNRAIDWNELVSRLKAVAQNNARPVIH